MSWLPSKRSAKRAPAMRCTNASSRYARTTPRRTSNTHDSCSPTIARKTRSRSWKRARRAAETHRSRSRRSSRCDFATTNSSRRARGSTDSRRSSPAHPRTELAKGSRCTGREPLRRGRRLAAPLRRDWKRPWRASDCWRSPNCGATTFRPRRPRSIARSSSPGARSRTCCVSRRASTQVRVTTHS